MILQCLIQSQFLKIKNALKIPLEQEEHESESSINRSDNSNLDLSYINDKSNSIDYKNKSVENYLTEEKFKILTDENYRSLNFKLFCKDNVQMYEMKAKYLIGLETNTFDWQMEMFQFIAQCSSFLKIYKYVDNLLNKINGRKKI